MLGLIRCLRLLLFAGPFRASLSQRLFGGNSLQPDLRGLESAVGKLAHLSFVFFWEGFMRFAVLPADGQSKRMGRPKLALPLGQRSVLEHVLAALRQAQVEHILVVIGPHVAELGSLAKSAGAHVCSV